MVALSLFLSFKHNQHNHCHRSQVFKPKKNTLKGPRKLNFFSGKEKPQTKSSE